MPPGAAPTLQPCSTNLCAHQNAGQHSLPRPCWPQPSQALIPGGSLLSRNFCKDYNIFFFSCTFSGEGPADPEPLGAALEPQHGTVTEATLQLPSSGLTALLWAVYFHMPSV